MRVAIPSYAPERLPAAESARRIQRVMAALARWHPEAAGLLVFSRLNLYYFTGTAAGGVLWIPRDGEPVLALRRAESRARDESPLAHIRLFRSFAELPALAAEEGSPWPAPGAVLAAEMGGLTWAWAERFRERLGAWKYVNADDAIRRARSVKSAWELDKITCAGAKHGEALNVRLPQRLRPGMSESDIARELWDILLALGHAGPLRMQELGDEIHLGHIAVGDSANYPAHFNGSLGLVGRHTATPTGGSPAVTWRPGDLLGVDVGFSHEGYQTDKTRIYFAGNAADLPDAARRAHDAALAIGQEAAAALRPGARPSDLLRGARERAGALGVAEHFLGFGENQTAFLGHGIGLSIDEWPPIAKGFDEPLEEDMVIALEPKIGLPGIGVVGMEETYRVTANGGVVLTGGTGAIIPVA